MKLLFDALDALLVELQDRKVEIVRVSPALEIETGPRTSGVPFQTYPGNGVLVPGANRTTGKAPGKGVRIHAVNEHRTATQGSQSASARPFLSIVQWLALHGRSDAK